MAQRSQQAGRAKAPVSFEEYKLYYESAERVTDRRLAMNRWNYSIAVATLVAIGGVLTWSTSHAAFLLAGIIGVLTLSGSACLMCFFWVKQIDDFKSLNTVKFEVLNEMASSVRFDGPKGASPFRSYNAFQKEWEGLDRNSALQAAARTRLPNVRGLRSSTAEYFIPRSFAAIFAAIFIATVVLTALSWHNVMDDPFPFGSKAR